MKYVNDSDYVIRCNKRKYFHVFKENDQPSKNYI